MQNNIFPGELFSKVTKCDLALFELDPSHQTSIVVFLTGGGGVAEAPKSPKWESDIQIQKLPFVISSSIWKYIYED